MAAVGLDGAAAFPWGRIQFRRTLHVERLVRSFRVELVNEGIEAALLWQNIRVWRRVASFFSVRCMRS